MCKKNPTNRGNDEDLQFPCTPQETLLHHREAKKEACQNKLGNDVEYLSSDSDCGKFPPEPGSIGKGPGKPASSLK